MTSAVVVTDRAWTSFLSLHKIHNNVNFWRRDTRVTHLLPGSPFYFKHKGQNLISGRGFLREQRTMAIAEAWQTFGMGNGVADELELTTRATAILKLPNDKLNCFILDGVEFLAPAFQPELPLGAFPRQIVAHKFFADSEIANVVAAFKSPRLPPSLLVGEQAATADGVFDPSSITGGRTATLRFIAGRRGQNRFRARLLAAYGNKCAVSGEENEFVLEAAHIYPYDGVETNNIKNGLVLRSDWHTLFDLGLWTIENDFTIKVSSRLKGSTYGAAAGRLVKLPSQKVFHPSKKALAFHRNQVFAL